MKDILYFLRLLCVNNNTTWFHANRPLYLQNKEAFEKIVNDLIVEISKFDSSVKDVTAKECMFRINRDIRFSQDKSPYKNHFGAYIAQGGKNAYVGGYYLHIEPDNSMVAGGIYMPPSDVLLKLRTAIYENPKKFISIIEDTEYKELFGALDGAQLKAAPRGFPSSFEHIDLLKYKSYVCMRSISDERFEDSDVIKIALDSFKKMNALNDFLNKALSH